MSDLLKFEHAICELRGIKVVDGYQKVQHNLIDDAEGAFTRLRSALRTAQEEAADWKGAVREMDKKCFAVEAKLQTAEQERDEWRASAGDWHNNATALEAANTALLAARDRLVEQWRKKAETFDATARTHLAISSVGLAQPAEWEASRLRDCADELSTLGSHTQAILVKGPIPL